MTLSLAANSQWYTTSLTPISSTPTSLEKEQMVITSSTPTSATTPVVELTEEVRFCCVFFA